MKNKKLSRDVIDKIRKLKFNNELNMTVKEIASELNVAASTVSKYTSTKRKKKRFVKVSVKPAYGLAKAIIWLIKEANKEEKETIKQLINRL